MGLEPTTSSLGRRLYITNTGYSVFLYQYLAIGFSPVPQTCFLHESNRAQIEHTPLAPEALLHHMSFSRAHPPFEPSNPVWNSIPVQIPQVADYPFIVLEFCISPRETVRSRALLNCRASDHRC